jgi:hypothetical protein
MPDVQAFGSAFDEPPFFERPNVPSHGFNGGNTWIPDVLDNLYPYEVLPWYLDDSKARARYMLEHAATLEVFDEGCSIRVRTTNETGHKLPSGYPEGRRMWIGVVFVDDALQVVTQHGAYDDVSADLTQPNTKVYEAVLGVDAAMAGITGLPEGPTFHFAVNNKIYKDNRIPPRGFTNAAFEAVQAAPIGAAYADGQYWDDTTFHIPPGATGVEVRLYYQTSSREYITFLRDANTTNDTGDVLYEQWELTGKSPPVLMQEEMLFGLAPGVLGDVDCNGIVDLNDFRAVAGCVGGADRVVSLGCEGVDFDADGDVDLVDVAALQRAFARP